jgi:acetyl esterase/lipase
MNPKGKNRLAAPPLKFWDVPIPTDLTGPEGMQVIFGDKSESYSAVYFPDIEYARYGERALKLNLLQPKNAKGPNPLLVYIQGSGWLPQSLYQNIPQLADFAHRGYLVASVEYRHSLEAQFPAQIQDVKAAIRFLRANAEKYSLDPERVAVWGDSSGGHLAAMTGVSDGIMEFNTLNYAAESSGVKAVVDFYGPTDLLQMNQFPSKIDHDAANSPESLLVGGPLQEKKVKAAQANPISYISREKSLPPFLIMHGDQDELVPFNQSVLLYQALKEARQDVTFYKVKGAGHGSGFWTSEVLEIVHKFLAAYL